MMDELPQYAELAALLRRLGYPDEPAEYHGRLCGLLCVRPLEEVDPLQATEVADEGFVVQDPRVRAGLEIFARHVLEALLSNQLVFSPLLPDDDEPLGQRVDALAVWCQGFLYGMASAAPLELTTLSPQAQEIIRDLTQFTQAGLGADDDEQIEEAAYTELVEYVRVGAQLLFMELHPPADAAGTAPTVH